MQYQPNLFIHDIGNASTNLIVRVIEDLGFGKVRHVDIRGSTAIIVMYYWDIPFTTATRTLLQEGKPLLLYYSETRFWKAYAYKSYEQRNQEKQIEQMLDYERHEAERRAADAEEEERLMAEEEERLMAEEEERHAFDFAESNIQPITLDYGDHDEYYQIIRAKYKAMFSKMRLVKCV